VLGQAEVKAGVGRVMGKARSCYAQYKVPGLVMVRMQVSPQGTVTSAEAQGSFAGTPTGNCVERAAKAAKFKQAQRGISVNYPFKLP
jgi:hypothetical protein